MSRGRHRRRAGSKALGLAGALALICAAAVVVGSGTAGPSPERPAIEPARPEPAPRGTAEVSGRVTDGVGRPLPGAKISVTRGHAVRTDAHGRYRALVRLAGRPATLTARRPGHVAQAETVDGKGRQRLDFDLWSTAVARPGDNAADGVILWSGCENLIALSDSELEKLVTLGVDGFVCQVGRLKGLGGDHAFTGERGAGLHGPAFALQRRLRGSRLVQRRRELGLKLYLGFYVSNYWNAATPLAEWFDDRRWSREVLPRVREVTAAARTLGFSGVAIDQELYRSRTDTATWEWDYPGNRRSESVVRAKATQRGAQLMRVFLGAFPGLEVVGYDTQLPGSWDARVQKQQNGVDDAYADNVQTDFWDGLTGVRGYGAIRLFDAVFYKGTNVPGVTWDQALQQNARAVYSLFSREFSDWAYAAPRVHVTPFGWIDSGNEGSDYERARPPDYVAEQLRAFRTWGAGGEFGVYAYRPPAQFDYRTYAGGLRASSARGQTDSEAPRIAVTAPGPGPRLEGLGDKADLAGTADDNLALRVVQWRDSEGRGGAARLEPVGTGAAVTWRIEGIPVPPGEATIWLRAEDIKGLATVRQLTLVH